MTITYNRAAGVFIWGVLGLFGKVRTCEACGQRVRPGDVGGFMKMGNNHIGVWHSSLPCIIHLMDHSDIGKELRNAG